MSLKYDNIVDRVTLSGRVLRWKALAFLLLCVAAIAIAMNFSQGTLDVGRISIDGEDLIGRITIDDFIGVDYTRDEALNRIKNDKHIKALIVRINSPGGSAGASEALYRRLLSIGAEKPVVAVLGPVAASGGYMIALAGDYIVANATTLTGSIGVIMRFLNFADVAKKVGVKSVELKTSEYKAAPSMFEDMSEGAVKSWNEVIGSTYDYFSSLVSARRNLSNEAVARLADGRVYTGSQALSLGLIDAIGGEEEAIQWLRDNDASIVNPVVRDVRVKKSSGLSSFLGRELSLMLSSLLSSSQSNIDEKGILMLM